MRLAAQQLVFGIFVLLAQKPNDSEFLGERNFHCPPAITLYLIRAAYENGGAGNFALHRLGSALLISHESLGRATGVHRTALLACLDFRPTEIFIEIGGAI